MFLFQPSSSKDYPRHYCGSGANKRGHIEPVVLPPGKGGYLPPLGWGGHVEGQASGARVVGYVDCEDLKIVDGSGL